MKYTIQVCRSTFEHTDIAVKASDAVEAEELSLQIAQDIRDDHWQAEECLYETQLALEATA